MEEEQISQHGIIEQGEIEGEENELEVAKKGIEEMLKKRKNSDGNSWMPGDPVFVGSRIENWEMGGNADKKQNVILCGIDSDKWPGDNDSNQEYVTIEEAIDKVFKSAKKEVLKGRAVMLNSYARGYRSEEIKNKDETEAE